MLPSYSKEVVMLAYEASSEMGLPKNKVREKKKELYTLGGPSLYTEK